MKAKHLSGHKSQKEKKNGKEISVLMENRKKYWLVFMTQKFYYRDIIYDDVATVRLQNSVAINMALMRTAKETEVK